MHSAIISKQNKIVFMADVAVLACLTIAWILYNLYGHELVASIYNGHSIDFLNRFISSQDIHPLAYYIHIAHKIMWRATVAVISVSFILTILIKIINKYSDAFLSTLTFVDTFLSRPSILSDFFCSMLAFTLLYKDKALYYSLFNLPFHVRV